MNRFSNVKFARSHVGVNQNLLFTVEHIQVRNLMSALPVIEDLQLNVILMLTVGHIQVKNLMYVLPVIKDFLANQFYKDTRQFTMRRENSSARCVLTIEVLKQKRH